MIRSIVFALALAVAAVIGIVLSVGGAGLALDGATDDAETLSAPEYCLAGLIVAMGLLAYGLFMSTLGRIIRDGDGDKREPPAG